MASAALPDALKSVTSIKIQELKKQRDHYESSKTDILRQAGRAENLLERTSCLLDGACRHEGVRVTDDSDSSDHRDSSASDVAARLKNQQLLLRQAKTDPTFPRTVVEDIHHELLEGFRLKSVKHQHAQFFSELVTEWLSKPDAQDVTKSDGQDSTLEESSFQAVGRREMHEQREQWEALVFSGSSVDEDKIQQYLHQLFHSSKVVSRAYEDLKSSTVNYSTELMYEKELFSPSSLKTTIDGILSADFFSHQKRAILKTFSENQDVLKEVADVLNMRFTALDTWEWSTTRGAINVEQRRQLNGKYRVFMDEDVLDTILVHFLGLKWAVHFKTCLTAFFFSGVWKNGTKAIPKADQERRAYFLGEHDESSPHTVPGLRRVKYAGDYFMTQLPIQELEGVRGYGDDSDDDDRVPGSVRKSPLEVKQSLLHLLITETLLAKHLRPATSHAVIRSDFKWFGPSLPHPTIFAVLEFFGVNDYWLTFFRKFLATPLRFHQDGPHGQIQNRQRGVPMSHALSDVFGEVILFVMDFAVNSATQTYLYRLHDDFWFWGSEDVCRRGWRAMTTFAEIMGLQFNEEKTGTVIFNPGLGSRHVRAEQSSSESGSDSDAEVIDHSTAGSGLPTGEVRWGFLRLDAETTRFVIDQAMVDEHIKELQLQLSHRHSIFSYIQSYNTYLARFFNNNFGKPSLAFGREHVDMMINTFVRIQKTLFPAGSVTDHLAGVARERFGVTEIPDGFWYWPVQMGGMELRNPLVPLFVMRESIRRSPETILERSLDRDEAGYIAAKDKFRTHNTGRGMGNRWSVATRNIPAENEDFMSKEEFLRYREERSTNLGAAYEELLSVPAEQHVHLTSQMTGWIKTLPKSSSSGIHQTFSSMQPYWKWTLAVYGSEIVDKYGSVQIVDPEQVPLGVVGVMKAAKIRWQG